MHAHDCSSALLSHAMAAPPPNLKVAITIHVAFERTVLKYAGLYDDTVTVKSIVDANLAKACESAARSLIFESASTFASAEDMRDSEPGGGLGVRFGCGVTFVCQCQYMSCVYLMSGDSLEI